MVHSNSTILHLNYELQTPGYRGYDRRHFPNKHSLALTQPIYKPRGRAHIPSPELEDEQWRPHGRHIEPIYSNVGPDWQSRVRYIPAPRHPDAKPTLPVGLLERNIHFIRAYPQNWQRTTNGYTYFADESPESLSSKRNHFAQFHLRSMEDLGDENLLMSMIGKKKSVPNVRNGISQATAGDKSYRTVEQSTNFHKFGSTLPVVDFGREHKRHGHSRSFVPMKNEIIPIIDENEFAEKEQQQEKLQVINEVAKLDRWKPAPSVTSAFKVFDLDPNDRNGGRYRPRVR